MSDDKPIGFILQEELVNAENVGGTPRFGQDSENVNKYTLDLSVARSNFPIDVGAGAFVWVIDATDENANVELKFNNARNSGLTFKKGMVVAGQKFDKIFFTNDAQASKTITFIFARNDKLRIENPAEAFSTVNITKPATLTTTADNAIATGVKESVAAADSTRHECIINNLGAGTVRVGDTNISATRGTPLAAGGTLILTTTAEIFVRNDTGLSVDISVIEILD